MTRTLAAMTMMMMTAAVPMPGQTTTPSMIDAGGHRLETLIKGEGDPTVVFDAGFIGGMSSWQLVQDSVAMHTRTLAYERAGLGGSDVGPSPRTAEQIATELRTLLRNAGISPPFVLVGHSAGGLFARVFTAMYPTTVAGLILVDPATVAIYEQMRTEAPERWDRFEEEVGRNIDPPPGWYGQWRALPQTMDQGRRAWPLPQIPVVVLTGLVPIPGEWPLENSDQMSAWLDAHTDLVRRIPGAEHIVLDEADHMSLLSEPVLVQKILEVVRAVRRRQGASDGATRTASSRLGVGS